MTLSSDDNQAKNRIKADNVYLRSDDNQLIMDKVNATRYFEDFRVIITAASNTITSVDKKEQKKIFQELCDLNGLYAVQLKMKVDLPNEVSEIAYDFDNPDYPGFDYVLNRLLNKGYKILRQKDS
jgi:hypothetical protein